MREIYTIGHSSHDNLYFLELLKKYNINCIVDIRSVPLSKYVPHFNKNVIKKFLNSNGIYDIYMAKEFGAVRDDIRLFHPNGYLDFEKIINSNDFKQGIKRLVSGTDKGYKICLMCTEKDPIDCHRSVMIAPELVKEGYKVIHILPNGSAELQEELEDRLLKMYFPAGSQQSLFSSQESRKDKKHLINETYKLRNADIGYRLN